MCIRDRPYTIDDGNGGTDEATLILSVYDGPPVAEDDINNTPVDTPVDGNVLTNDDAVEPGDTLTVTEVNGQPITGPIATDCGTVEMHPDGTYTFTPLPGLTGVDTFTYTVVDQNGNETEATVTIDITDSTEDPNSPPIAGDDNFETFPDTPITSDLSGNDGDPDGDPITVVDPATGEEATGPILSLIHI